MGPSQSSTNLYSGDQLGLGASYLLIIKMHFLNLQHVIKYIQDIFMLSLPTLSLSIYVYVCDIFFM